MKCWLEEIMERDGVAAAFQMLLQEWRINTGLVFG